jgi:hypothetical protein
MAWIAALAGAAVSAYGAKKQGDAARNSSREMNRLYGQQADLLGRLSPFVIDYFNKSKQAYEPAFRYYSAVAGGDRQAALSAVAPETNAIAGKYRTLVDATRTLQPRGGASASYNADLAFRSADEQQAHINQQRTMAIANLVKMAGLAGDLGAGAAGNATDAAAGASGLLSSMGAYNQQAAAQQAAAYSEIGKALAGMFGSDDQGWYFGNNRGRG